MAGEPERGEAILAGRWRLAGATLDARDAAPWDAAGLSLPARLQLHGMGWLDDLLCLDRPEADRLAAAWVADWVERFGRGAGPGWMPATTGRRLTRWIDRSGALAAQMDAPHAQALTAAAYGHARALHRGAEAAPAGLPRIEALSGLALATLALRGLEARRADALARLDAAVDACVDRGGGLASRNPEAALEVAALLARVLAEAGAAGLPAPGCEGARARLTAALRVTAHADGALARFHGGGPGRRRRLAGVVGPGRAGALAEAMGFARMAAGEVTVIVDAARPPEGPASGSAHASTGAFEMTVGRHPLIVGCGPGGAFGADWHRAGRVTASHSVLDLGGIGSSGIGAPMALGGHRIAPLAGGPAEVGVQIGRGRDVLAVALSHDGYVEACGLTHLRRLTLSSDGARLTGEDALRADGIAAKERFEDALAGGDGRGLPFSVRFHLHPDLRVEPDGAAARLILPSGEAWRIEARGEAGLAVEPSVYLDAQAPRPRAASQVVLSGRCLKYAATVGWALARAAPPAPCGEPS
jgi:uncharacterized heparinase superfamily protein